MAFPVTINGRTYTLADFEGTNYVDGFPDALEDFVTQAGDIYNSTSTSSVAIGTGSKSFTTADSDKPYQPGTPLRIADAAAPATNFMDCIVTSYSGTSLVVDSIGFGGSGTKSSWTINIGGAKTVDGTLAVNQGGTGATTASAAASNLGLGTEDSPTFTGLTVTSSGDFSGATISDLGTVTTADINGGTIDGVTIGGASAGAGTFTTITGSGDITINDQTNGATRKIFFDMKNSGGAQSDLSLQANNGEFIFYSESQAAELTRINSSRTLIHKAAATFNEDGGDSDFRVESDTNTHALFVEASTSRVGINTSDPSAPMQINSSSSTGIQSALYLHYPSSSGGSASGPELLFTGLNSVSSLSGYARVHALIETNTAGSESGILVLSARNGGSFRETVRMSPSIVTFNEGGDDRDFRVETDSTSNAFVVDAGTNQVEINTQKMQRKGSGGYITTGTSSFNIVSDLSTILTSTPRGAVISMLGFENGDNNASYRRYMILRRAGGYSLNEIDTGITYGNTNGNFSLSISGSALVATRANDNGTGGCFITFDIHAI